MSVDTFTHRLSEIDWSKVSHAYGEATDTPYWLNDLRSQNHEVREKAMSILWGSICHQGSRYAASVTAIPFLLQLLRDPQVQAKHEIIYLLVVLVIGCYDEYLSKGFDIQDALKHWDAVYGADGNPILLVYQNTYQSVLTGVGDIANLIDHPELDTSLAVGFAIAWFRETAQDSVSVVRIRLSQTTDVSEMCNLILALGTLDLYLKDHRDLAIFRTYLTQDWPDSIRVAASCSLAKLSTLAIHDDTTKILFGALSDFPSPPKLVWSDGFGFRLLVDLGCVNPAAT